MTVVVDCCLEALFDEEEGVGVKNVQKHFLLILLETYLLQEL